MPYLSLYYAQFLNSLNFLSHYGKDVFSTKLTVRDV